MSSAPRTTPTMVTSTDGPLGSGRASPLRYSSPWPGARDSRVRRSPTPTLAERAASSFTTIASASSRPGSRPSTTTDCHGSDVSVLTIGTGVKKPLGWPSTPTSIHADTKARSTPGSASMSSRRSRIVAKRPRSPLSGSDASASTLGAPTRSKNRAKAVSARRAPFKESRTAPPPMATIMATSNSEAQRRRHSLTTHNRRATIVEDAGRLRRWPWVRRCRRRRRGRPSSSRSARRRRRPAGRG